MLLTANRPTQTEIKQLLWAQETMPDLVRRYPGLPFSELLGIVHTIEPRRVSVADRYWSDLVEGMELAEVAEKYGHDPSTIVNALIDRGYDPVESGLVHKFRLSQRIAEAWASLDRPLVYLRQLMEEEVEAVRAEGKIIKRIPPAPGDVTADLVIPFAEEDLNKLRFLTLNSGTNWHDGGVTPHVQLKVLRALLEDLIAHMPELARFRPPHGEKRQILPHNKLKEDTWRTSFSAPWYAYALMLPYKGGRGAVNRPNLSTCYRGIMEDLRGMSLVERAEIFEGLAEPLKCRTPTWLNKKHKGQEIYQFNRSISLSLLASHQGLVTEGKAVSGLDHHSFLVGLFLWSEGVDQAEMPGWQDWVEFASNVRDLDSDEIPPLLESLVANGFVGLSKRS